MLSRTADNLYWLARYLERAEGTTRLLETAAHSALLPLGAAQAEREWEQPLLISGCRDGFATRHGAITGAAVLQDLTLESRNPASILCALRAARENAAAARSAISAEMWECLNGTWLALQRQPSAPVGGHAMALLERLRERLHLFWGVTESCAIPDEATRFLRLGTQLERADGTARVIGVYAAVYTGASPEPFAYYRWAALLRALGVGETDRNTGHGRGLADRAIEELLLRAEMPRSLHAALDAIEDALGDLDTGGEVVRRAGGLHAQLHSGRIEAIQSHGLQPFLAEFLAALGALDTEIRDRLLALQCV